MEVVTTAKVARGRLSSRSSGTLTADTTLGMADAGQQSVCQTVERIRCEIPDIKIILSIIAVEERMRSLVGVGEKVKSEFQDSTAESRVVFYWDSECRVW